MINLYQQAHEWLQNNIPFALAVVIQQEGSTPRGPGAKMLVTNDTSIDTIGGGAIEGHVIQEAQKALQAYAPINRILSFDLSVEESGGAHACGGNTLVALLFPQQADEAVFAMAAEAQRSGEGGAMVFATGQEQAGSAFYEDNHIWRADSLPANTPAQPSAFSSDRMLKHDSVTYVLDPIPRRHTVHLFGGGHVSLAVSNVLPDLGFAVTVYEDRAEFANPRRFPNAGIVILDHFNNLPDATFDATDYIVILTRGHQFDKDVLKWALPRAEGYIGMIGSKNKCHTIFEALKAEGVTDEDMARVHAPIGLPIGGDTPEEIAISIAAQLVEWRWQHRNREKS